MIEYEKSGLKKTLMMRIREVNKPGEPDMFDPATVSELRDLGFIPAKDAEDSILWLLDRLTPEAKQEIEKAVALTRRFPDLLK